jgi:Ornithine/acetylornithine aminotransferase
LQRGLGGGIPIGCQFCPRKRFAKSIWTLKPMLSTFGGKSPLPCASAVATLETILEDGYLLDYCQRISKYFMKKLYAIKEKYPEKIKEIRGMGLLVGIELNFNGNDIVKKCMEKGLLIGTAGDGSVLRFTPPLIIEKEDVDEAISILDKVIREV